jgi:hypothetical protein
MGEQLGITCDSKLRVDAEEGEKDDLYDTSCVMTSLSGNDQVSCVSTVDEAGRACQWCSVQGIANVCLTEAQAEVAGGLGVTCGADEEKLLVADSPLDPSCVLAYIQDQTKENCLAAIDQEGNPCEFCHVRGVGSLDLCLTPLQARGLECEAYDVDVEEETVDKDLYDKSCVMAYLQGDGSKEFCQQTVDEDGNNCKWCHNPVGDICLTDMQGDMVSQLGFWCDDEERQVAFPDDFWTCLQNYEENGCSQNSCTWCSTSIGMGFCMAPRAAEALKECTFFDCQYNDPKETADINPYDPACLAAGMGSDDAEDTCNSTTDSDGNPCVWCDAAGVFGLCLSSEQAEMAGSYLQCDKSVTIATE